MFLMSMLTESEYNTQVSDLGTERTLSQILKVYPSVLRPYGDIPVKKRIGAIKNFNSEKLISRTSCSVNGLVALD